MVIDAAAAARGAPLIDGAPYRFLVHATQLPRPRHNGAAGDPPAFELMAGDEMAVLLDFDAEASVKVTATGSDKFILRPVVNGSKM